METEKHYFKVGLFFIAVMGAFIFYLMMFGGGNGNRNLKPYLVYFDHSVDGLVRGAPVKLRGIAVGQVNDIRFLSTDNDRILVTADIADTAPVRTDTMASVAFQGITGAAYLSLENTSPAASAPRLTAEKGQEFPVIPSRQSGMQLLLANAPVLMDKLTQTVNQTQKLLSDKNIDAAGALLPETHDALAEATAALREIKMLAHTLREDPSLILHGPKYEGYQVPKQ